MWLKYIPPLSYWFDIAPMPLQGWQFWAPFSVFGVAFLIGIIFKILATQTINYPWRVALGKFGSLGWTMGLLGLLLIFFEYERVPGLRMRILFLVWFLASFLWTGLIIRWMKRAVPQKIKEISDLQAKQKYLPKKK